MADMLYEAVNTGDVDAVMDLLKKGLPHLIRNIYVCSTSEKFSLQVVYISALQFICVCTVSYFTS